jgi:NAD(P)-dependent dehydrogenase (short-subunit alcohol dehydrogenase family)
MRYFIRYSLVFTFLLPSSSFSKIESQCAPRLERTVNFPSFDPFDNFLNKTYLDLSKKLGLANRESLKILVVGGGRGIGRGFSEYFAAMGAEVLIASQSSGVAMADEIGKTYDTQGRIVGAQVDFSREEDVREFLHHSAHTKFLRNVHIVVFSAGLVYPDGGDSEETKKMIDLKNIGGSILHNTMAEWMMARFEKMKAKRRNLPKDTLAGIMIAISSVAGSRKVGRPLAKYAQSNLCLHHQMREVNERCKGRIRAVAVASVYAETDMTSFMNGRLTSGLFADLPDYIAERTVDIVLNPEANRHAYIDADVIIPGSYINRAVVDGVVGRIMGSDFYKTLVEVEPVRTLVDDSIDRLGWLRSTPRR